MKADRLLSCAAAILERAIRPMKDLPGVILVATIWAYWFGVGIMIVRVRRQTHTLAGLVPEHRLEQYLWLLWVPLVAAWIVVPYLALVNRAAPWTVPSFARASSGYSVVRWLAAAAGVCALLLTSVCWSRMGRNWRMAVSKAKKGELITDGPFRFVRHPIYALSRLLMACSALVLPNWPMLALLLVHFVLTQVKARTEEEHLLLSHGDAYRDYRAHTGGFLPRLRPATRLSLD